jgi:magnesium chelatase subunit D
MSPRYPFSAIVGQQPMKLALVLNAINPKIGGVLIRGQKGTAKSTAARGLAALLPPLALVDGCRFGCAPDRSALRCPECEQRGYPSVAHEQPPAFVELPVGATEDRVIGSLDVERILADGHRHFEPGLLARANRGLLYVDEVNLLPDHLVDTLLDAAAMGVNTVERDGVSFTHPAAFVLVGTMNPEEGDLRPQLLDRFGLAVDVNSMPSTTERAEVVRRRIAFEQDPIAFATAWAAAESAASERIRSAQTLLDAVRVPDNILDLIARICTAFEVDGLRADIMTYKAAATLAAYTGRQVVTPEDVRQAAELALPHRRRRQPFDQPGLDRQRLDDLVDDFARDDPPPDSPPRADDGPPPDLPPRADDGPPPDLPPRPDDDPPPPAPPQDTPPSADSPPPPRADRESVFDAAAIADFHLPAPTPARRHADPTSTTSRVRAATVAGPRGRHVRSVATPLGAVDVLATVRAAVLLHFQEKFVSDPTNVAMSPQNVNPRRPHSGLALRPADLHYKLRAAPVGTLTVFVVDASGSMAARRRTALAKGAVMHLLLRAYQTRQEVALIAFRGAAADVLLPPTSSVQLASTRLRELPTGGRTPLALALRRARGLLHHAAQRHATHHQRVVLISDGRANVPLTPEGDAFADALVEARYLRSSAVDNVLIDMEDGPVRLHRAAALASELGATYLRLANP